MPPRCHRCSKFSVFIDLLVYFSVFFFFWDESGIYTRGIEWSFGAFCEHAFEQCVCFDLFLRARAVIDFLMPAASTLEITNGEQRALRTFSASWNLSSFKHCFAPSNLDDTFKTGQQGLGQS